LPNSLLQYLNPLQYMNNLLLNRQPNIRNIQLNTMTSLQWPLPNHQLSRRRLK
jgi:hypothetical protein